MEKKKLLTPQKSSANKQANELNLKEKTQMVSKYMRNIQYIIQNQNYTEIQPHPCQNDHHQEYRKLMLARIQGKGPLLHHCVGAH